ncbi:MAG: DEAD/DEAH box helicase [Planctomycetaceae bacterium]|nr:DEAD/DEAH box helicase [Planctomycetaceae bacterium]
MNFEGLGLHAKMLSTLQKLKYNVATPIQIASIPAILAGKDVLGCAETGSGKTAAFCLPILQRLFIPTSANQQTSEPESNERPFRSGQPKHDRNSKRRVSVLVLTPTRELANQVSKSFASYGRALGLRQAVIYGGVSQNPQIAQLRIGVDIVVATPGRLLDLMGQGEVELNQLKVLVLDEADQMLDMGFIQPLKRIVSKVPKTRQTLMFSATMPAEIQSLAEQWLVHPVKVQANELARPPEQIKQAVAFVAQSQKADALIQYLQTSFGIRQLVFCRTKHGADRLAKMLDRAKISAVVIHGNKSQNARERALASFCSEEPPILVATDVAARGLHLPGVTHVINYDLPNVPETYVHRIGRTARAGAAGQAISFCSPDEKELLRDIERLIGSSIPVQTIGTSSPVASTKPSEVSSKRSGKGHKQPSTRPAAAESSGRKRDRETSTAKSNRPTTPSWVKKRKTASERQAEARKNAARKAAKVQKIRTATDRPDGKPAAPVTKKKSSPHRSKPNLANRDSRPRD